MPRINNLDKSQIRVENAVLLINTTEQCLWSLIESGRSGSGYKSSKYAENTVLFRNSRRRLGNKIEMMKGTLKRLLRCSSSFLFLNRRIDIIQKADNSVG